MKTFVKLLGIALATLLIGLSIISCGTRNVKKTEIKEEIKTETEISAKTDITTESDKKTDTKTESDVSESLENLTPINPDKPMKKTVEEKDGKKITTWENATVNSGTKTDKSKKSKSINEVVKSDFKGETDFKVIAESKKTDESKITESDKGFTFNLNWLWLLLIPLGFWWWCKAKK